MKDIGKFTYFLPTKIVFGQGKINDLGNLVKGIGKRALIVTGGKSAKSTGLLDKVVKQLDEAKIGHVHFDKIVPNPLATTVDEGAKYLPVAYKDGKNIEARTALAWASTAAGICETLSGCIANHALEHPVSGYYNVTHGVGLCATGPTLFEYILKDVKERLAKVALTIGAPGDITDTEELAKMSIELLKRLQKSVDLDVSLSKIGVERSKIKTLAADAMRTMGGLVDVTPGNLKLKDLEEIYERSF